MKSTKNCKSYCSTLPFPKLMENKRSKNIWLMITPDTGTRVYQASYPHKCIGQYVSLLKAEEFIDFKGQITLEN